LALPALAGGHEQSGNRGLTFNRPDTRELRQVSPVVDAKSSMSHAVRAGAFWGSSRLVSADVVWVCGLRPVVVLSSVARAFSRPSRIVTISCTLAGQNSRPPQISPALVRTDALIAAMSARSDSVSAKLRSPPRPAGVDMSWSSHACRLGAFVAPSMPPDCLRGRRDDDDLRRNGPVMSGSFRSAAAALHDADPGRSARGQRKLIEFHPECAHISGPFDLF
jgi:hypothetical protein